MRAWGCGYRNWLVSETGLVGGWRMLAALRMPRRDDLTGYVRYQVTPVTAPVCTYVAACACTGCSCWVSASSLRLIRPGGCSAGHYGPAGAADAAATFHPGSPLPPRRGMKLPAGVMDSEPGGGERRLSQPPQNRWSKGRCSRRVVGSSTRSPRCGATVDGGCPVLLARNGARDVGLT